MLINKVMATFEYADWDSWRTLYFSRELVEFKDKVTGNVENKMCELVCKVTVSNQNSAEGGKRCGQAFVFNKRYGTGNLTPHLLNKHSIEVVKGKTCTGMKVY